MLESDEIWEKVRPFMNAENDQLFKNLRDIYREGIPSKDFSLDQINGSKKIYSIPVSYTHIRANETLADIVIPNKN